jgi:hypothetical protein
MSSPNVGRITQVIGSTLDAQFAENSMPALYNALSVQVERTVLGEKQKETSGARSPSTWAAVRSARCPSARPTACSAARRSPTAAPR